MDVYEALERPSPKPTAEEHAPAGLLEALAESPSTPRSLEVAGSAAGRSPQAWRAVLAAPLRFEPNGLGAAEGRRRPEGKAAPGAPDAEAASSRRSRGLGYADISARTSQAPNPHGRQRPDTALSKYWTRLEAVVAVRELADAVVGYVERLRGEVKRTREREKAVGEAKRRPDRP